MGGRQKELQTTNEQTNEQTNKQTNQQTNTTNDNNSPPGFFQNPRANKSSFFTIIGIYLFPTINGTSLKITNFLCFDPQSKKYLPYDDRGPGFLVC